MGMDLLEVYVGVAEFLIAEFGVNSAIFGVVREADSVNHLLVLHEMRSETVEASCYL